VVWRIKDYALPGRDAIVAMCGSTDPLAALETLITTRSCCERSYLSLDYEVDDEFKLLCQNQGVGLMCFTPRNGYFKEIVPAEERLVSNEPPICLCARRLYLRITC